MDELVTALFDAMLASPLVLFAVLCSVFVLLPGGTILILREDDRSRRVGWCCVMVGGTLIALYLLIGCAGLIADTGACYAWHQDCQDE